MANIDIPSDYRYLYEDKYFKKESIIKRFEIWLERIDDILFQLGLSDLTRIDCNLLSYAVLDYYVDISRIKDFHGMERVNVHKIYSYGLYWLLRKKPIQILQDMDERFLYVNEKVLLMMTLRMMFAELEIDEDNEINDTMCVDFMTLFYYNLKFRTYTPKSIELALESIQFGFKGLINKTKQSDFNNKTNE